MRLGSCSRGRKIESETAGASQGNSAENRRGSSEGKAEGEKPSTELTEEGSKIMNPWSAEEIQKRVDTNLFDVPVPEGPQIGRHFDQAGVDDIIDTSPDLTVKSFHERNRVANRVANIFVRRVKNGSNRTQSRIHL